MRVRAALALLAAMSCVVLAGSFHLGSDNDFARAASRTIPSFGTSTGAGAADDCPACRIEGLATAALSVCPPVAMPSRAGRILPLNPPALDFEILPPEASRAPPVV